MIEWVVGHLGAHGVDEAVLALGYRPEPFLEHYADGLCAGVRLHYAVEDEPLDTAGAVRFAARDAGHRRAVPRRQRRRADRPRHRCAAGVPRRARGPRAPSTCGRSRIRRATAWCRSTPDGRVIEFVEKPPRESAPSHWINAGTYVLEPSVLDRIDPGRKVSIEREVFPAMAARGSPLRPAVRRLLDRHRHARDLRAGAARPGRRAGGASRSIRHRRDRRGGDATPP